MPGELCTNCKLCQLSRVNCMLGEGPEELLQSGVMFVGEAPGAQEEKEGSPFVGDSGWLLDTDLLPAIGLQRSQVHVTNACRCRPPNNRTPEPEEVTACRPYLVNEIKQVQPKLVFLLGATAMQAVFGTTGIEKWRGQLFNSPEFPGVTFLPTYHPARLWRVWQDASLIHADLQKGISFLRGEFKIQPPGNYTVCDDIESVRDLCSELKASPRFAFDTETTGLNHQEDGVLCMSFSCMADEGYTIPLYGQYQKTFWHLEQWKIVLPLLRDLLQSDTPKIAQNGVFDILFCKSMGIEVNNFQFDTMLAAHLINENLSCSLDTLITLYTGMPVYSLALDEEWKEAKKLYKECAKKKSTVDRELRAKVLACGENYGLIPNNSLWKYAAADADATFQLADILEAKLHQKGLHELFTNLMMPMTKVITTLRWNGVLVDQKEMFHLQDKAEVDLVAKQIELEGTLGQEWFNIIKRNSPEMDEDDVTRVWAGVEKDVAGFNTNSTKQLTALLIDKLGWPVLKKSDKTGNPSFDKEVLAVYAEDHKRPAAIQISAIRLVRKLISDFLGGTDRKSGVIKHIHKDGRVHPDYKLTGTDTGRLSTADPALHNASRTNGVRGCYVPPPGWWWFEVDYSQLELRVLAYESKDAQLTRWFAEGRDVHRMVTAQILGIQPDAVSDEQRTTIGKPVNFGLIYGMTAYTLAKTMGVSEGQAQEYINVYFDKLPGVKGYFQRVYKELYSTGKLVNAFGRIRHLHGAQLYEPTRINASVATDGMRRELEMKRRDIQKQAINFPIQSEGSDVLNYACIRIDKRLEPFKATYNHHHHDALHLNVPPDELVDVARMVIEEMERPVPQLGNWSFPVDFKVCTRWYDKDETATNWLEEQLA